MLQWLLVRPQGGAPITTVEFQNILTTPQRNPNTHGAATPLSPNPIASPTSFWCRKIPTCFLPLWTVLFWTFHINGNTAGGLLRASFTQRDVVVGHPRGGVCRCSGPPCSIDCVHSPRHIHPFIAWWALAFPLLTVVRRV